MSRKTPTVVAFVSGKGGSGKTTVSIAMAKFLAEMGHRTLLIDFDLSTSGASYFFRPRFSHNTNGIWEWFADTEASSRVSTLPLQVEEGLYFAASRTRFTTKGKSYDSLQLTKAFLQDRVLKPLINYAYDHGCSYVLIDCQAGYSTTSEAACELSNSALIVAEADAISSDAADNLLLQMATALPSERRFLINKIDVRDADAYRSMKDAFQALNRLPPLPFDRSVRTAFGARRIPLDLNEPSPLLFALIETMAQTFPELAADILDYKQKHVDRLLEQYTQRLDHLSERKKNLMDQQARLRLREVRFRADMVSKVGSYSLGLIIGLVMFFVLPYLDLPSYLRLGVVLFALSLTGFSAVSAVIYITRAFRSRLEGELESEQGEYRLARALEEVNKELEIYRSLVLARSKEYLLDYEVAKNDHQVSLS